jgi:hypothetical protein
MRVLKFAAAILVVALAGCATPPSKRFPEITFQHLPLIRLDVAEIVYNPRYQPPVNSPNIGQEFPTPPATAAERWISDRLVAAGTQGQAVVTIVNANATETRLAQTKGLKGAFTTDQEWRYDAQVEMAIEVVDYNRQRTARATASAKQSRTVPEDASLADREQVWFNLTETLMGRFDQTFEAQIRKDLNAFIK